MVRLNKLLAALITAWALSIPVQLSAQGNVVEPEAPSKYVEELLEEPKLELFQGFSASFDVFSVGQKLLTDYGGFEAALKVNLYNTFFPVIEAGLGSCDHTDGNTNIQYKASAPYLRAGVDFNLLKNKFQRNLFYAGVRYGISNFKFDISGPEFVDPVWGGSEPFSYKDISTTSHWFEVLAGAQVQIYKNFHMGWTVRYKHEISSSKNNYANPYYIPGYGTTKGSSVWGATYSLIFDLNWGKKKTSKQHVISETTGEL